MSFLSFILFLALWSFVFGFFSALDLMRVFLVAFDNFLLISFGAAFDGDIIVTVKTINSNTIA